MPRFGKTLRDEEKGRDAWNFLHFIYRPLQLHGDTPPDRLRGLLAVALLGIGVVLLLAGYWIIALLLFALIIAVWVASAPSGPFYKDTDD